MTNEQVTAIERIYRTETESGSMLVTNYNITLDELSSFDASRSWVFFDETNNMIHCIRSNNDHYTQVRFPMSIASTGFDNVVLMEALVNMSNFEAVLDALCPNMDEDIKASILKRAENICGHVRNLAPMEERPYFKTEPYIGGKVHEPIPRPDLGPGDTVYDQGGFDNI